MHRRSPRLTTSLRHLITGIIITIVITTRRHRLPRRMTTTVRMGLLLGKKNTPGSLLIILMGGLTLTARVSPAG